MKRDHRKQNTFFSGLRFRGRHILNYKYERRIKMAISIDKAKSLLEGGISEAQELIQNPSKVDENR